MMMLRSMTNCNDNIVVAVNFCLFGVSWVKVLLREQQSRVENKGTTSMLLLELIFAVFRILVKIKLF